MNQEKIGKFIAELRKEQKLTQQQLADALSVSNKTISKWECGKGMPELSLILPLCETLHISINELLSGERLSETAYPQKAEEHIMNLMQEKETLKKNNHSFSTIIITSITLAAAVWFTLFSSFGLSFKSKGTFIDENIMLFMLLVTVFFLLAAKLGKSFLLAFKITAGREKNPTEEDIRKSYAALSLASSTLLGTGILTSVIGFGATMLSCFGIELATEAMNISLYTSSFGLLYGIICYLFFLPFKARLQAAFT